MSSSSSRPPTLTNLPPLKPALKPSQPGTPGTPPEDSASLTANSGFFPRTLTGENGNGYTSKVGFDTFQNPSDAAMFSYTLQVCRFHVVSLPGRTLV